MARRCDLCGTGPQSGNNVSHSKRHTRRRWLPNLRTASVVRAGQASTVRLCMRCLRSLHKLA